MTAEHFAHPRLASTEEWRQTPSLVLSLSHFLSSNWCRKTRANMYRARSCLCWEHVCFLNKWLRRVADGKELGIKTIPMSFLRKCQLGEGQNGSSTPCVCRKMLPILTARRDTLKMIPVGGIPQHKPQPQGDSRSSEILRTRQNFITRELPNSCLAIDAGGFVSVSFSHSTALSRPELVWLRVAWMSPLSSDLIHQLKCLHTKCWSCSIFKCLHHPLTLRRKICKKSAKTGTSLQLNLHRLCPNSPCEGSTKLRRKVQRGTENVSNQTSPNAFFLFTFH